MSGKRPLFVSAPRMILGIEDSAGRFNRLAYAIGLNLRVSVNVQPITVMGSFAPIGYEPVQYQPVQATMQIIKLQRKSTRDARTAAATELHKTDLFVSPDQIKQNAEMSSFSPDSVSNGDKNVDVTKLDPGNSILEQSSIFRHLDPLQILMSESFDVKIYMNINGFGDQLSLTDSQSSRTATGRTDTAIKVVSDIVPFMTIKDCRLTGRSVTIQQGQLLTEPVNIMGLLAIHENERLDTIIQEKADA